MTVNKRTSHLRCQVIRRLSILLLFCVELKHYLRIGKSLMQFINTVTRKFWKGGKVIATKWIFLHFLMFHSEILSPWSFLTFWNGLPGIGRQLCIKMWFWHFSTHKIYVTVHGKFSEPHFVALFFSNPGEKVWKARKTLSHMGQSFPYFSNLLPGIGEKQSNKVWFWEFSTHRDIYFVCGKMPEPHFNA